MSEQHRPPESAEFFAGILMPDDTLRDAFLGDLAEEYADVAARDSITAANTWYWSQLASSFVPLATMAISRRGARGALRFAISVVVGYAMVWTTMTACLLGAIWSIARANDTSFVHGAFSLAGRMPLLALVAVITSAVAGSMGGFVMARIDKPTSIVSALTVASASIQIVLTEGHGSSLWFLVTLSAIAVAAVFSGAVMGTLRSSVVRCR